MLPASYDGWKTEHESDATRKRSHAHHCEIHSGDRDCSDPECSAGYLLDCETCELVIAKLIAWLAPKDQVTIYHNYYAQVVPAGLRRIGYVRGDEISQRKLACIREIASAAFAAPEFRGDLSDLAQRDASLDGYAQSAFDAILSNCYGRADS